MNIRAIWHHDSPAVAPGPTLLARFRPLWRRRPRADVTTPKQAPAPAAPVPVPAPLPLVWPPSPEELARVEQRIAHLRRILARRGPVPADG